MSYEARTPEGQALAAGEIRAKITRGAAGSFRGTKDIHWAPGSEKLRAKPRTGSHSGIGPVEGTFERDLLLMDLNPGVIDANVVLNLQTKDGIHYIGRWKFAGYSVSDGGPCRVTLEK